MPRIARGLAGDHIYRVINRGNNRGDGRQEVFHKNGDYAAFIDLVKGAKEMEFIREGVNRQSPYGQADWRDTISQELGLESTTRPKGRPKKKVSHEKK